MTAAVLALVLLSSPARAGGGAFADSVAALRRETVRTPEEAAAAVLRRMRATMRYAPEVPSPRGPHEWTGRRAVDMGTVNGCVESAKAFLALFRAAFPDRAVRLIDSFDSAGEGGHAVDEVEGSSGAPFLVDAASFERLPGKPRLGEADLAAEVDIRPGMKGRILQFRGRGDFFVEKRDGRYRLAVYPFGRVFDGPPVSEKTFATLDALNEALAASTGAAAWSADFRWLLDHGLILSYDDPWKTGFLYQGASGGLSRHVVYACRAEDPAVDGVTALEPAARERYAREGRGGCAPARPVKNR